MVDKQQMLYSSIVSWINKLEQHGVHKEKHIQNILDLKDGVILSSLFNYGAPENMRVPEDSLYRDNDNWAFTLKNLNTLYDSIQHYNQQVLQRHCPEIEFLSIFNEENKQQMIILIEEVLGVVLQSESKNEYITAIMELEDFEQEVLSHFIKKLLKEQMDKSGSCGSGRIDTDMSSDEKYLNTEDKYHSEEKGFSLSDQRNLLKKIDELESEQLSDKKRIESIKKENESLKNKIVLQEKDIQDKQEEIEKFLKQKDVFLSFLKCSSFEEITNELKSKSLVISELNKIIEELKSEHLSKVQELEGEIQMQERRLEKFKNYDKVVDTVKTLNEENKYLEKRIQESDKIVEEVRRRNAELISKVQDKEEAAKKKFEAKQLLETKIELETELGMKNAECEQLQSDVTELQLVNQKQEESIKALNLKVKELNLLNSGQRQKLESSSKRQGRRVLSQDFNEVMNRLTFQELRQKGDQKQEKDEGNKGGLGERAKSEEREFTFKNFEEKSFIISESESDQVGELRLRIRELQEVVKKGREIREKDEKENKLKREKAERDLQQVIEQMKEEADKGKEEFKQKKDESDKLRSDLNKMRKNLEFFKIEAEDNKNLLEEEIKLLVSLVTQMADKTISQQQ